MVVGKDYGSGSSRDWAAKGPFLLGIKAVIAESYERIHRSNLVGMGIIPLQFLPGQNAETLNLSGREQYNISIPEQGLKPGQKIQVEVSVYAYFFPRKVLNVLFHFRLMVMFLKLFYVLIQKSILLISKTVEF